MPKLKTNKSAKKRFKLTKRGKLKRYKQGKRHLLTSKSSNRKLKEIHYCRGRGGEDNKEVITVRIKIDPKKGES